MKHFEELAKAMQGDEEFVVATIVGTHGSAPAKIGFRMIAFKDKAEGTVGGGALEKWVIEEARTMLKLRAGARLMSLNLSQLEMECGGAVQVFMEPIYKKPPLWIFGAGHVARALAPLITSIGFRLTVTDNREGFSIRENFPAGATLKTMQYDQAVQEVPAGSYAVIVTHGHEFDQQVLLDLAAKKPPLPYIGMIGSKKKVLATKKALIAKGVENHDNIFTPIGLSLGGDSPQEIAIAIAGEILGHLHRKTNLPHCRLEGTLIT